MKHEQIDEETSRCLDEAQAFARANPGFTRKNFFAAFPDWSGEWTVRILNLLKGYDLGSVAVAVDGLPIRSASVDMRIEVDDEPPTRPIPAGVWSHTFTLNSAEVEAARAAAHPDDVKLADEIAAKITADLKRELERISIVKGT